LGQECKKNFLKKEERAVFRLTEARISAYNEKNCGTVAACAANSAAKGSK
jgi:hypothetical protein